MKTELKEINLLNDAMFKALFRSIEAREMVATFLSRVTGIDKEILKNAEYQGGELPKKNIHEKGKVSDVIIKIQNNNKIVLEMNQHPSKYIFEKNTSYAFSVLSESIPINAKAYPYVFLINLDNFNAFKTDKPILHFKLRDEYGHIETEIFESIHLILENIISGKYNEDIEIKKTIFFLKSTRMEEIKRKYKGDEKYMAAFRRVEDLSTDPNFVGYYDIEEARKQDLEDMRITGFEEGAKQKQIEIAKNLLKKLSVKDVAEHTGLSIEEVEELMND